MFKKKRFTEIFLLGIIVLQVLVQPFSVVHAEEIIEDASSKIDIQNSNEKEKEAILSAIDEEVSKQTDFSEEEKANYRQTLINFYDSSSENYGDLDSVVFTDNSEKTMFRAAKASHGLLSVRALGSIINVAIAAVTGGSISAYVRKHGFKASAVALQSRLAATIQLKYASVVIKGLTSAAIKLSDPGLYLAQLVDKKDKIRNNGYIELW